MTSETQKIFLCQFATGPTKRNASLLRTLPTLNPFSHMVWIEPITGKSAEEVYTKFVEGFLLEEGAPFYILTDNGREFDSKLLNQGAASVVGASFVSHTGLSSSWELYRASQQVHR